MFYLNFLNWLIVDDFPPYQSATDYMEWVDKMSEERATKMLFKHAIYFNDL